MSQEMQDQRSSCLHIVRKCRCFSVATVFSVLAFTWGSTQAAPVHIRLSTPEEVAFADGISPAPLPSPPWFPDNRPLKETSDYWEHEGLLWRLTGGEHPAEPNPIATPSDPLSITVPLFDYARKIDFAVEFQENGNLLTLDAMAVAPTFITLDLRYPEDYQKEYVHPLGTLPSGAYLVTARLFEISADFDPDAPWRDPGFAQIDFLRFKNDPLGYELPEGFSLSTTEEQLRFNVAPGLQPGDADQDLSFDQLDIVLVAQIGKYLSGQPATWGEGDWNGAPGGLPGNPPPGNGLFDEMDVVVALAGGTYLQGRYAVLRGVGREDDGQTSIGYDAITGKLWVDAPAGQELTSININSAAGIFTGQPAQNLGGSFDNDADNTIFKATFGGSFGSISFGHVAQADLSEEFVMNDFTVVRSLAGGGELGAVDLVYVPEPTSALLFTLGIAFGLIRFRRTNV